MNRASHQDPVVLFIANAADLRLGKKENPKVCFVRSDIRDSPCVLKDSWAFYI